MMGSLLSLRDSITNLYAVHTQRRGGRLLSHGLLARVLRVHSDPLSLGIAVQLLPLLGHAAHRALLLVCYFRRYGQEAVDSGDADVEVEELDMYVKKGVSASVSSIGDAVVVGACAASRWWWWCLCCVSIECARKKE